MSRTIADLEAELDALESMLYIVPVERLNALHNRIMTLCDVLDKKYAEQEESNGTTEKTTE